MTRAQTVDVLNDSTTLQSRIDTVLATPDLDWANDSGWHPGDPLYEDPRLSYNEDAQVVRHMIDVFEDGLYYAARCKPCQVSWRNGDTCWNCGTDYPRPSYGNWGGTVTFDETHDWARASLQPFVEAMDDFSRQMAQLTVPIDSFRPRYVVGFDGRGRSEYAALTFTLADPELLTEESRESWARANAGTWRLLPSVADVNAPTLSEIQQGEPLAAWERELLGLTEEPVIRIPVGTELTPAVPVPMPESIDTALLGGRRRPESRRYYFDRPVTETRRT